MRWVWLPLLLAGCGDTEVCDGRAAARRLAGGDAVDCGSPEPYEGRGLEARELSVACMADALEAGTPFYGFWLDGCQLDVCFYEGRAYDGERMYLLEQSVLKTAPTATDAIRVASCVPVLRTRQVTTPAGEVIRREIECRDVDHVDDDAFHELDDCPTRPWEPPAPSNR